MRDVKRASSIVSHKEIEPKILFFSVILIQVKHSQNFQNGKHHNSNVFPYLVHLIRETKCCASKLSFNMGGEY